MTKINKNQTEINLISTKLAELYAMLYNAKTKKDIDTINQCEFAIKELVKYRDKLLNGGEK